MDNDFQISDGARQRLRFLSELTGTPIIDLMDQAVGLLYAQTGSSLRGGSGKHRADPEVVDALRPALEGVTWPVTTAALAASCWPNSSDAEIRSLSRKIGTALRFLGYTKRQTIYEGRRAWWWFPPPASSSPEEPVQSMEGGS